MMHAWKESAVFFKICSFLTIVVGVTTLGYFTIKVETSFMYFWGIVPILVAFTTLSSIFEIKVQHIVHKEGIKREIEEKNRMIEEMKEHVPDMGVVTELIPVDDLLFLQTKDQLYLGIKETDTSGIKAIFQLGSKLDLNKEINNRNKKEAE